VTDLSDLDFTYPDSPAPNVGAAPRRKCPHPRKDRVRVPEWSADVPESERAIRNISRLQTRCGRCGHAFDPATQRRGRNNKSRGLALQRKVLAAMDLEHIPGNKENHDGRSRGENGLHVAEVKSGLRFNAADYANVVALPAKAGQARWLVKVETPGPGRKARVTVTTTLEDWQGLFVEFPREVDDDAA
jgi:hypothetical protein